MAAPIPTWLCTLEVKVDLPVNLTAFEMEAIIAQAVANQLPSQGYTGNCIVTLVATAGGVNVLGEALPPAGVVKIPNPNEVGVLGNQGKALPPVENPDPTPLTIRGIL